MIFETLVAYCLRAIIHWPKQIPAVQMRVARPTNSLRKVTEFYHDGLGLPIIDSFDNHRGYSGVMIGAPDRRYHLEFTEHDEERAPRPHSDALLVFYIPDARAVDRLVVRLRAMGYPPVAPANPYWNNGGVTIEDPDGARVVLMRGSGL